MGEEVANLCGGPQMASTDSTQVGERLDGAYGPAGSDTVLHARMMHTGVTAIQSRLRFEREQR